MNMGKGKRQKNPTILKFFFYFFDGRFCQDHELLLISFFALCANIFQAMRCNVVKNPSVTSGAVE